MYKTNLNDTTILNISIVDFCCIISGISKNEALNLFWNNESTEKKIIKYK